MSFTEWKDGDTRRGVYAVESVRGLGVRTWTVPALAVTGLVLSACSGTGGLRVDDGTYGALVPSSQQFSADAAHEIPGGFVGLRDVGIGQIDLRIEDDLVVFRLDGAETSTRQVVGRLEVTDSEGSGPFRATKEVLSLGDETLVLGGLALDEPVIWPGSFEEDPVITVKSYDRDERGPVVSCRSDESCLLLSSGVDPTGRYEDANNPALDENPIASIEVSVEFVDVTLDTGRQVRISRRDEALTRACGLSETAVWEVPADVGLAMDDPVLIHTLCPSNPGAPIRLTIMERAGVPVLAPLAPESGGDWCPAGPKCLWFVPV